LLDIFKNKATLQATTLEHVTFTTEGVRIHQSKNYSTKPPDHTSWFLAFYQNQKDNDAFALKNQTAS